MIARVALPIPHGEPFDYLVPEGMEVALGHRVQVPLGRRRLWGIVVALEESSSYPGRLQKILRSAGPVLSSSGLSLIGEVARESFVSPGLALGKLVPSQARPRAKRYTLAVSKAEAQELLTRLERRAPAQARALGVVIQGPIAGDELRRKANVSSSTVAALVGKGLLRAEALPFSFSLREPRRKFSLTEEQRRAVEAVMEAKQGEEFLLFGPAGAGKTEVYLRVAQAHLAEGRGCLLLEPEVSLLPQLWARAEAALREDVALYFGDLPPGERWRVWEGALQGEVKAVAGTRSAVFLPLRDLGLIVLDEEGEPAYKQADMAPYYHARRVAELRAGREGAVVLLGSAAPQLETFFRAEQGEIRLLRLSQRVVGAPPEVRLVSRGEAVIGEELREAMERHLAQGGQVLLFLNRMGFFTGAACRRCRAVLRCPGCEVPLVFHLAERTFRCHMCGRSFPEPSCPACGGQRFRMFGLGTERVEHEVRRLFPSAAVARLDTETAPRRGEILAALAKGEIDVLVGTQMVGKGLDFPRITLVGVINADGLLSVPDFRAGERTFQLVSAAAGRAGRGERPGEVIVQTDQPDHYAIRHAARGDYEAFYRDELRFREALSYPPFSRLVRILVEGKGAEEKAIRLGKELASQGFEVLGPARLLPRRGTPRWHLLLKGGRELVEELRRALPEPPPGAKIEPDPMWLA